MKRNATPSKPGSSSNSRRSRYTKVLDNRKHPIRGLWRRNGAYIARITVEDAKGRKKVKWGKLKATTAAEAADALKKMQVQRDANELHHVGQTPKLSDYIQEYIDSLATSSKREATVGKETGCLRRWSAALGHWRLDQLRPSHVTGFLDGLKANDEFSGRTVNLYLIALRHVMKRARRDSYLKTLPTDYLEWEKSDSKKRELVTQAELNAICEAALKASKNGQQFTDYIRLMAFCGARRNEALNLRWDDVNFERKQLTIGGDGSAKNREPRWVDFNPTLEAHLREMHSRRAPDSKWLFPSPQRGEKDVPAKTFMESLRLARQQLPDKLKKFGFHDCRHCFISFCVMSGVDFMSIARWVGHKDGGILIGKVYGHLSDEHRKTMAAKVVFAPVIVEAVKQATG